MFQNSYQNGTYFDVFDPKTSQQKMKFLYRINNVQGNNKVFDKDLKTFVMEFTSPSARMSFPKEEKKDLYLIQQYLVLQIFFFPGMAWNVQLVVSDLTKTKRRIILSPSTTKTQIKPFFVKTPCHGYAQGLWNNFVVDLYSYIEAFKGQTYRSLDAIYLTGHFKLRRIYSTTAEPKVQDQSPELKQIAILPKQFYYPMGLPYATKVNCFEANIDSHSHIASQHTESSSKNSSFVKSSKPKIITGKVETVEMVSGVKSSKEKTEAKRIRDFLSNTNGQLLMKGRKQGEKSEAQYSELTDQMNPKTAKSNEKYTKTKLLVKTQNIPPKARSSMDKNSEKANRKVEDKTKTKAKLNPWRNNTKQIQTQTNKNESNRALCTPQSESLYKTKNNLPSQYSQPCNRQLDRGSDHYSDSQYVQLSQKFTTLSDGKFFKHSIVANPIQLCEREQGQGRDADEIEENIEMECNSMRSSMKKEIEKEERKKEHIIESICDSLDGEAKFEQHQQMGKSSLYGFGQQLMKDFMGDLQRPYSPPMGEREQTEQQVTSRHNEKEEVQLIYDPVLNCYYDHRTHTYYQLKNQ